jgi:peptidoglycan/LPS O-acetylase OafA/YrhL
VARGTLGERFDGRPNALNLLRLALAMEVLGWHAATLRGATLPPRLHWFLGDVGVDAFFAVSGFVITAAWLRRPDLSVFLASRARRLLPGLWTCLVVTAFVIVPVAVRAAHGAVPSPWSSASYVLHDAGVLVTQWTIPGTTGPLVDHGWNGSLWTLAWEAACYLAVAGLGVAGLVRPRIALCVTAGAWALSCALELLALGPYDGPTWLWMPPRTALMFGLGATLFLFRDRVPYDARLAWLALASVAVGPLLVDDYRVIAAPGVAYLCLWFGVRLGGQPRAVLRTDLSYGVYIYGFPLQQALLLAGWHSGWLTFFAVSTLTVLPVAAASWFLVERRVLRRGPTRMVAGRGRPGAKALVGSS